jgi:hypothetical protein
MDLLGFRVPRTALFKFITHHQELVEFRKLYNPFRGER